MIAKDSIKLELPTRYPVKREHRVETREKAMPPLRRRDSLTRRTRPRLGTTKQLGTAGGSFPRNLGLADFELSIFGESRPGGRLLQDAPQGTCNAAVAVQETQVDGLSDILEEFANHTFIMNELKLVEKTMHLLKRGRFSESIGNSVATQSAQLRSLP